MPSNIRSQAYFAGTKVFSKLLAVIGDPLGKFYSAPNMTSFAKSSQKTRVQKSIIGLMFTADHEICSEVMKSSNWISRPLAEKLYTTVSDYGPEVIHPFLDSIIALDGPDQKRIKKVLLTAFTPKYIDTWRTSSERIIGALIQKIDTAKPIDFVESFANPLPLEIVCEIIGVPQEHWGKCNEWGKILGGIGLDLPKNASELANLESASKGLVELIAVLLEQRKLKPTGDLISVLASAESDGQRLTDKEIIASAAFTLIAGFETTMNLLSVSMLSALENPNQLAQLAKDKNLLQNFIEESLRVSSPIQFVVRTAQESCLLADGTAVKKGQTILLNLAGANRDPLVFVSPDDFDLNRENARKHVAFGFGAHHCIGALLARVEAEVLWTALLEAYPNTSNWQLAGVPKFRTSKLISGLDTLPMLFGEQPRAR